MTAWIFAAAILFAAPAFASPPAAEQAYQLPQTVYVGDRAVLAAALSAVPPGLADSAGALDVSYPADLFGDGDLVIHRCTLERRAGRRELRLEFTAFRPGVYALPPLALTAEDGSPRLASPAGAAASGAAGLPLAGLTIHITSILEGGSEDLSGPVGFLTMPGTFLLINGAVIVVLAAVFFAVWGRLFGRRFFAGILDRARRRRLCAAMIRLILRMKADCERGGDITLILSRLSAEMRGFLTSMTGLSCAAMAAAEFSGVEFPQERPGVLCPLFVQLEDAMYSGRPVPAARALIILDQALAVSRAAVPRRGGEA